MLVHLARLAVRIPNPDLARHTWFVMCGFVFVGVMHLCGIVASLVFGARLTGVSDEPDAAALGILGYVCILTVMVIIFTIWALILIFRYRHGFREAALDARASWAGGTPETLSPM